MAEPTWHVELNARQTGWWIVGPEGSPSVEVWPCQHITHAPEPEDFARAAIVAQAIVDALNTAPEDRQAYWERVYLGTARMVQLTTLPAPESDALCEWERGVCLCPGCAGVVRLVPRAGQMPRVVDADGRQHRCQREIAAVLQRHGVSGMEPLLAKHGARPVVVNPETVNDAPESFHDCPNPERRTLDV